MIATDLSEDELREHVKRYVPGSFTARLADDWLKMRAELKRLEMVRTKKEHYDD